MDKRQEYAEKLNAAKEELKNAGCIHRRDLIRQINQMKKDLMIYDRYQREAARFPRERSAAPTGKTV